MLKILQVTSLLNPELGGAPISVLGSFKQLNDSGIDCSLLVCGENPNDYELQLNLRENYQIETQKIYYLKNKKSSAHGKNPNIREIYTIIKLIKKSDLLILNQVYSITNLYVSFLCRKFKIPYYIYPHGSLTFYDQAHHKLRKNFFNFLFFNRFIEKAESILVASKIEGDQVKVLFNKSVTKLGLGFPEPNQTVDRRVNRERNNILFIGRITEKKRIDLTIEAFIRVASEKENLRLFIVGDGNPNIKRKLSSLVSSLGVEEKIEFIDWIDGALKHDLFQNMDYFVLNSEDENFAVAVAESLFYGVPVLVTEMVALSELINEFKCGVVIKDVSVESISNGFEQLLSCDYQQLSQNALKAANSIRWENVIKNWIFKLNLK